MDQKDNRLVVPSNHRLTKSSLKFLFGRFLFSFPVIFVLVIAFVAYLLLGREATRSIREQTHDRQLHLAQTGASTVTNFVNLVENSLVNVAKVMSQTGLPPETVMQSFADDWRDTPIIGTIFVDPEGFVINGAGQVKLADDGTKVSVADRDYFQWAKTAKVGESYVGAPLMSRVDIGDDSYVVTVSTPVFRDGQFAGVLAAGILVDKLADQYLNLLKFTDSTRIYLINSDSTIIYSPFPQLQGVNYIKYLNEHSFPGSFFIRDTMQAIAAGTEPHKLTAILPNAQTKIPMSYLIATAPVVFAGNHWTIAVATPLVDALAFASPIYINQIGVIIAAFLILLVLAIRAAKKQAYKEMAQKSAR